MIGKYAIGDHHISSEDSNFSEFIEAAYDDKIIPICLCQDSHEPLKLYIAYRHNQHILARYPDTGHLHNPKCDHYEAPDHLTGYGHVNGSAIIEDNSSGDITLKFGFPMSIGAPRSAPTALTNDKPVLKVTGTKLTIRGLLHFLWDKSHLTHWHPAMYGKRNWFIARREILNAALSCKVKDNSLYSSLFLPENFALSQADQIKARALSVLGPSLSSPDKIMILVGEVKEIKKSHYGHKLLILHSADRSVNFDYDEWRRFEKRFAAELMLWADDDTGKIVTAVHLGKSRPNPEYDASLKELMVMPGVNHIVWMPGQNLPD
jgi:hypothetical protein